MITLFLPPKAVSYEEISNIELLRSLGHKVVAVMPPDSDAVPFFAAKSVLAKFGVELVRYTPGDFESCQLLLNFGHPELFQLINSFADKPKRVLYWPNNTRVEPFEAEALSQGLIDELALKDEFYSVSFIRELVDMAQRGVESRSGYVPFCNPASPYFNLSRKPKSLEDSFLVLKDTNDEESYSFPNFWRMLTGITIPHNRRLEFKIAGLGPLSSELLGDPTNPESKWFGMFNVELFNGALQHPDETQVYRSASVLLHFFPKEEPFSFAVARAMLSGAVPVVSPTSAHINLVEHGKTGLVVGSAEEAAFSVSKLAWEPNHRARIALQAYKWIVAEGPANTDKAARWWQEVLPCL